VSAGARDHARLEQAFSDLKTKYPSTVQTSQAGLTVAKTLADAGNTEGAKDALAWVASRSGDVGLQAVAKLRLAGVLMDQKNYDEALKQLSSAGAVEFDGAFADRRGDLYLLQDNRAQAIAEYTKAYKSFEEGVEYRRLVEIKLGALGASPQSSAVAAVASVDGVK
jgi:predicted negative regulator of RcsB-dependent stress response